MSVYLHEVPGRLRIKVPELKRNPRKAHSLPRRLTGFAGVLSASINPTTGSLLVHYDPDILPSEALLSYVCRELELHLGGGAFKRDRPDRGRGRVGEQVSKALLMFALDRALQGSPLSILAAFI
jgi:hypothetical protein